MSYQLRILSPFPSTLIMSFRLLLYVAFLTCLLSIVNSTENRHEILSPKHRSTCKQSNTCDSFGAVPSHLRDLRTRNCMCDDKCALYNDCCSNANKSSFKVNKKFICVETPFDGHIYMVKSCPNSWNSTSVMKKCMDENGAASSDDFLLKIPVTGHESGITYGNVFCAICNEEKKYFFWDVGVNYEKVLSNLTMNSTDQNAKNSDDTHCVELDNRIFSNLAFNKSGDLSWSSNVNGSFYRCRLREKLPENSTEMVRYCLPNVVQTCRDGSFCGASTSYVYADNKVYKNANCATCNHVSSYEVCFDRKNHSNAEVHFSKKIIEKYIPKGSHCAEIPTDSTASDLFCPCSFEYTEETLCYIDQNFSISKNEVSHIHNEAIFLTNYNLEIPCTEYVMLEDNDTIYVCRTEPLTTQYQEILTDIIWLAYVILVKVSIICMLLHLLAFSLISEMQNLSGKNLASFCVALLLAYILSDIGPWLPSCKETSMGLHYCLLSCFTWTLVMSYDLWSSLYRASSNFRFANGKHGTKFLIYSAIAWILPLSIIGPAAYIEFSPSSFIHSDLRPAYGENWVCFIGQSDAMFYFFVLPVTFMIIVNICLFAHVAYYIYLSRGQSVNPDTRNHLLLYSKLAFLMGLDWILGIAYYITDNELIALLYIIIISSQGIFIFCVFTFQRRNLTSLSKQSSRIGQFSRRLSSFLSTVNTRTANTVTSETSTDEKNIRMAPI